MIAITGATGHLGNNLVRALVERRAAGRPETIRCLVLPSDDLRPLAGLDVEVVRGDVRDIAWLLRAFDGADVVFHLASVISITSARRRLLHEVNVGGTQNVVRACLECGVRRLVYTSSVHALVEPPHGVVIDESVPFDPDRIPWDYGKTKAKASLQVLDGVRRGLDAVILCPTGMIGPYDFQPSEMGELFISYARRRLPAYVEGGYDFVDVRDVAEAHIAAAERGATGESYLLSGEQITVRELFSVLAELTGVPAPRLRVPHWMADAIAPLAVLYYKLTRTKPLFTTHSLSYVRSNSRSSSAKAARELGFRPRPVRESIADAVEWLDGQGMLRPHGTGKRVVLSKHAGA